jgi:hypothetical protein
MPREPRPIFTERWQEGLSAVAKTGMPATLRLFRLGERVYDPATNTYVDTTETLYTGKARVQPLRSSRFEPAPMDSAYWQTVLISIPIEDAQGVDFRVADQARVTEAPLNEALLKYQFAVNEIIDSSNPFERTLLCSVDLEAVA